MIDRRQFLHTFGASAVVLGQAPLVGQPLPLPKYSDSRTRISLNGEWEYRLSGNLYDTIIVPCSRRPSGYYSLKRNVILPKLLPGQRVFAHFEAITYWGSVTVNRKTLGSMGPYLPYEFEFSSIAKDGDNEVEVEIADLTPWPDGRGKAEITLGLQPGWEAYGGIIRDAWMEIRPSTFIGNVRFAYKLSNDYRACACTPRVMISSTGKTESSLDAVLSYGGNEVSQTRKALQLNPGINEIDLSFEVRDPALWSPELPNLYELTVSLTTPNGNDSWHTRTGFREIKAQGRIFLLNGRRLVMKGVCRHDMWKDQGFTLSRAQQEQDMRMIKAMGCNFVRLAHYPHDRHIIELADEFGIFVSEEPGFWNMDFSKMPNDVLELGCSVLEGVIRRDWNSPAVAMWLLGNESDFTVSYLKRGKAICDQLDPIQRLVSAAHINGELPQAKRAFDECGLDFYDFHAYYPDLKFAKIAESFGPGKPLTLTEWGWEDFGQGVLINERDFDGLLDQIEQGKISGHMYWSWNDVPLFNRKDSSADRGILRSGAVTETREIREPIYSRLVALFAEKREEENIPKPRPIILPLCSTPFSANSTFYTVDLQPLVDSQTGRKSWDALETAMAKSWANSLADNTLTDNQLPNKTSKFLLWQQQELKIAGVLFRTAAVDDHVRPVLLTTETPEISIAIHQSCNKLHILGQVTFPVGYPVTGKLGDEIAVYTLQDANGKTKTLSVRNGIEVVQSNLIYGATRIDPIATKAQCALQFNKDVAREQYRFLLWSVPVQFDRIQGLRCRLKDGESPLAILAITTESGARNEG
jgi:hypothetical protein